MVEGEDVVGEPLGEGEEKLVDRGVGILPEPCELGPGYPARRSEVSCCGREDDEGPKLGVAEEPDEELFGGEWGAVCLGPRRRTIFR